jgi:hypothetical protein
VVVVVVSVLLEMVLLVAVAELMEQVAAQAELQFLALKVKMVVLVEALEAQEIGAAVAAVV